MAKYSHDSLGAPDDIIEDDWEKSGKITFNVKAIHINEGYRVHLAYKKSKGKLESVKNNVFVDDIYEYIKTLLPEDLLEILSNVNAEDILIAANMDEEEWG